MKYSIIVSFICFLISCNKTTTPINNTAINNNINNKIASNNTQVPGVMIGVSSSNNAMFSYTTNEGEDWSIAQTLNGLNYVNSIAFASTKNGVVIGGKSNDNLGYYSYTTNSGQSWSAIQSINDLINI